MNALDFEYAGTTLSSYGFIICDFNSSSGANTISAGSEITFNTVPLFQGRKYALTGIQFDSCITATFDICKNPDTSTSMIITPTEFTRIMKWLNRKTFFPFRLLNDDAVPNDCYFDASFNISKIKVAEKLVGLELTMQTNRPYGYGSLVTNTIEAAANTAYTVTNQSQEIGYFYPKVVVTCNEAGTLTLTNARTGSESIIKNCTAGEVITMSGESQIITSSVASHSMSNDFNFQFFTLGNVYSSSSNSIKSTLSCTIEISYNPIIKNSP